MHFDRLQTNIIWRRFLEWEHGKNVQFNYLYVPQKNSIEIWVYFQTNDDYGELLRTDMELNVANNDFSTQYLWNWTESDLNKMVDLITQISDSTMEDWQKI